MSAALRRRGKSSRVSPPWKSASSCGAVTKPISAILGLPPSRACVGRGVEGVLPTVVPRTRETSRGAASSGVAVPFLPGRDPAGKDAVGYVRPGQGADQLNLVRGLGQLVDGGGIRAAMAAAAAWVREGLVSRHDPE